MMDLPGSRFLPPGCTDEQIDRAAGSDEEHDPLARCHYCWRPSSTYVADKDGVKGLCRRHAGETR